MNKTFRHFTFLSFLLFCLPVFGQSNSTIWSADYAKSKSFIENKGQFDEEENALTGKIKFAIDFGSTRIYFGQKGISYSFLEAQKIPKAEREQLAKLPRPSVQDHKRYEKLVGKFKFKKDEVNMVWANASSSVELIGLDETPDYHNYSVDGKNGARIAINQAKGFKKILYKNVYDHIDVEYVVHPEIGVKYALILHPGADPSKIAMEFDRSLEIRDGKLSIPTDFGPIIDHAPITFYEGNQDEEIESHYLLNNKTVSFSIAKYNPSRTVIIDPWTQTPTFATNWDVVWECERDAAGNVYILGGIMPMQILKYNTTGTLQWTYNTPYDTSNVWLGTFAVDNAGNSYVTAGSVAQIQKISPAGALLVNNSSPGGIISSAEFWTISFNCDQTALIIGGTGGSILQLDAVIYNVNTTTLNISNEQFISNGPMFSIPPDLEEVRSITSAPNGKYYFMTHDTIGYMNDNFTLCPNNSSSLFKTNHGAGWGYKCENFRYDNTGMSAITADETAVYLHRGNQLQKRSLQTGAVLQTVAIPNGGFNAVFLGGNVATNSGIAVDDCGNVYVGSTNGVYKFNSALVQQGVYATTFKVFDVEVNSAGEIIACGGTGTSADANRSGGVAVINATACIPIASTCCDASICIPQSVCQSDAPFPLTTATAGGTWSGPGVSATGVFSPSVAGVGIHTITYTLPCGSESITITVSSCQNLQVCVETNGNLTVSGGVGPYTWQQYVPAQNTPITTQAQCQSCGYTWFFGQCLNGVIPVTSCSTPASWTTFGTGTSVTPPVGATQLQVIDGTGAVTPINPLTLQPCGSNPCPTISITVPSQQNVACFGAATGTATVLASGGSGTYNYVWTPGNLIGGTQNGLAAGTYTIGVIDGNNCPGTGTVTITQPTAALTATTSSTNAACGASNGSATVSATGGTAGYTYSWSPSGGTGSTASNLAAGTYTVQITDANSCQTTATATVNSTGGPTISVVNSTGVSCFGTADGQASVTASGGTGTITYVWNPGNLSGASQNNLAAGTYTVTATDGSGCSNSTTLTISTPAEIILNTVSIQPATCGVSDGSATVSASGGTGNLNYAWSPTGGSGLTATSLAGGTYTFTATDQSGCAESLTLVVNNLGGPIVTVSGNTAVSCAGASNGSASVTVSGGSGNYSYSWVPSGGSTSSASNLSAGTYTVQVTDLLNSCIGTATVTITQPNPIAINETITPAACGQNDGVIQLSVTGGVGPYTYNWNPGGVGGAIQNGLSGGAYSVTVTDANGCLLTENYTVSTVGSISLSILPVSANIQQGDSVQLDASGNAITWSWSPPNDLSCSDCPNPIAYPQTTTIYTVTGTDAEGCVGTAEITITVDPICGDVYVPTVFSPNGNGYTANNMICVYGNCIATFNYAIFNRWGEKVFETSDLSICWDGTFKGKDMNSGVFAYKLTATLQNGQSIEESGNLTLIR